MASRKKKQPVRPGSNPIDFISSNNGDTKNNASLLTQRSMRSSKRGNGTINVEYDKTIGMQSKPKIKGNASQLSKKGCNIAELHQLFDNKKMETPQDKITDPAVTPRRSTRVSLKSNEFSLKSEKVTEKSTRKSVSESDKKCIVLQQPVRQGNIERNDIDGSLRGTGIETKKSKVGENSVKVNVTPCKTHLKSGGDVNSDSGEIEVVATLPANAVRRSSRKRITKSALELLGLRPAKQSIQEAETTPNLTIVKQEPVDEDDIVPQSKYGQHGNLLDHSSHPKKEPDNIGEGEKVCDTVPSSQSETDISSESVLTTTDKPVSSLQDSSSPASTSSNMCETTDENLYSNSNRKDNDLDTSDVGYVDNISTMPESIEEQDHMGNGSKNEQNGLKYMEVTPANIQASAVPQVIYEVKESSSSSYRNVVLNKDGNAVKRCSKQKREKKNMVSLNPQISKQTGITQAFFDLPKVGSSQSLPQTVLQTNSEEPLKTRVVITYAGDVEGQNRVVKIVDVTPTKADLQPNSSSEPAQVGKTPSDVVRNITFSPINQSGSSSIGIALGSEGQHVKAIEETVDQFYESSAIQNEDAAHWKQGSACILVSEQGPVVIAEQQAGESGEIGEENIEGMKGEGIGHVDASLDTVPEDNSIQFTMAIPEGTDTESQMACEVLAKLASGEGMVVAPSAGEERQLYQVMVIDKDPEWTKDSPNITNPQETATILQQEIPEVTQTVDQPHRVMELGLPCRDDGGRVETLPRLEHMKQLIVNAEYEEMVKNLKPSDSLENHANITPVGRGKKVITCKHCQKEMTDRHAFRRHMQAHTDIEYKPWKCPLCPYRATVRAQIGRHINIHSSVKGYVCKECGKGFNFKQKLVLHMKYHLDIRDKQCHLCYMAFHEYKTLKNHMRKIHGTEEISVAPRRKYVMKEIQELEERMKVTKSAKKKENVVSAKDVEKEMKKDETQDFSEEEGEREDEEADAEGEETEREKEQEAVEGEEENDVEPVIEASTLDDDADDSVAERESLGRDLSQRADNDGVVANIEDVEATETFAQVVQTGLGEFILVPCQTSINGDSDPNNEAQSLTPSSSQPAIPTPSRRRGRSHLYGTKKTLDYTRKYKEGKLPIADRNEPAQQNSMKVMPGRTKTVKQTSLVPLEDDLPESVKQPPRVGVSGSKASKDKRFDIVDPDVSLYCNKYNTEGFGGSRSVMYRCKLCPGEGPMFASKTQYLFHLEQKHRDIQPWCCHLCNYSTRMRTSLLVHLKIHSGVKDHSCHICGKAFAFKQKLKNHMSYHLNRRAFKCNLCEKGFNEKNDLSKHMKRVHTSDRPFCCPKCNKNFKDLTQVRRHMVTHGEHERLLCPYCNRYYRSKTSLAQHMKSHTCMFHCEICDKNFGSYSGFMAHKVMHDESYEGYQCDKCPKVLHTKGSLTRHRLVCHSSERPYGCDLCIKRFKTKKDLKNHGIVHTNQRQFMCDVCQFQCKRVESLRVHMRRHQEVKPFGCEYCGKEYTQKHSLVIHMRTHTGEMPVQCNLCDKGFTTKRQVEQHMKQKHMGSILFPDAAKTALQLIGDQSLVGVEKPLTVYMCEECNAVFMTQDNLAGHILVEHMKQRFFNLNDPAKIQPDVSVGNTVEIVTQPNSASASTSTQSDSQNKSMFDGQHTVETLVAVSDPGGSQSKLVSLIHPVENQQQEVPQEIPKAKVDPRVEVQHGMTADPDFGFTQVVAEEIEDTTAGDKFAALLDPERSGEALVAIADPQSQQEMLVSVNQSNLETLLAVTESQVEQGLGMGDHYEETYVAVAETVEIPIAGPTETVLSEPMG